MSKQKSKNLKRKRKELNNSRKRNKYIDKLVDSSNNNKLDKLKVEIKDELKDKLNVESSRPSMSNHVHANEIVATSNLECLHHQSIESSFVLHSNSLLQVDDTLDACIQGSAQVIPNEDLSKASISIVNKSQEEASCHENATSYNQTYISILGADALPTMQITRKSIPASYIPNLWLYLLGTEGLLPSWCVVDYKSRLQGVVCLYLHGVSDQMWQRLRIHPSSTFSSKFTSEGHVYLQAVWNKQTNWKRQSNSNIVEPLATDRMQIIQWDVKMLRDLFYVRHEVKKKKRPDYSSVASTIQTLNSSSRINRTLLKKDESKTSGMEANTMQENLVSSVTTKLKNEILKNQEISTDIVCDPTLDSNANIKKVTDQFILNSHQLKQHEFPSIEEYAHFLTLPEQKSAYHLIAIDCEMCETTAGKELTRVSIVDEEHNVLYDNFVKPEREIINYYTQFSGITFEILEHVTTTLKDVQEFLCKTFSKNTIIVGHSLENDLMALQLVHERVIDTSVIYPHANPNQKHKLKNLCKWWLGREIQVCGAKGHNSIEDAIAAMELTQRKIKYGRNFGEYRAKEENFLKQLSQKNISLVDKQQDLRYIVNGSANAISVSTDEEAVQKIVQTIRKKKLDFIWGHFHTIEKWYQENAKSTNQQNIPNDIESRIVKYINTIMDVCPDYTMICILGTPEMYTLSQMHAAQSKCRDEDHRSIQHNIQEQSRILMQGSFAHFCIKGLPIKEPSSSSPK